MNDQTHASRDRKTERSTLLHVDLKALKGPWQAWCAARNLTPSEAVRRVLGVVLKGGPASQFSPHPINGASTEPGGPRRLEIRLTAAEHAALSELAAREGMSVPRWLTGLVRLHLVGEQQFGAAEMETLLRSNQLLLALGRNINQIAYNMNQRVDKDELTLAQIEYVAGFVKSHTDAVSLLVHANSKRWRR